MSLDISAINFVFGALLRDVRGRRYFVRGARDGKDASGEGCGESDECDFPACRWLRADPKVSR